MRYVYATFYDRQQAEEFLYDMWACAETSASERPRIERCSHGYAITLSVD